MIKPQFLINKSIFINPLAVIPVLTFLHQVMVVILKKFCIYKKIYQTNNVKHKLPKSTNDSDLQVSKT